MPVSVLTTVQKMPETKAFLLFLEESGVVHALGDKLVLPQTHLESISKFGLSCGVSRESVKGSGTSLLRPGGDKPRSNIQ